MTAPFGTPVSGFHCGLNKINTKHAALASLHAYKCASHKHTWHSMESMPTGMIIDNRRRYRSRYQYALLINSSYLPSPDLQVLREEYSVRTRCWWGIQTVSPYGVNPVIFNTHHLSVILFVIIFVYVQPVLSIIEELIPSTYDNMGTRVHRQNAIKYFNIR